MKQLLTLLFSILYVMVIHAQSPYQNEFDIPYSSKTDSYSKERLKLDIHHHSEAKDLPVIVWFHGGGLTGGNKFIPGELMDNGYVVVAPNYRLIPNVNVDDCIDDAAEAVAWVFANIRKYGGDPSKIFVSGHSAGGFLTSMVGLDKSRLNRYGVDADSIAALFPYSGQVITHFSDRKSKGIGELTPYIDNNAPLFLYMWRMMKLTGHPDVKIFKLDGYNHGDMASPAHHIMKHEISRILSEKAK